MLGAILLFIAAFAVCGILPRDIRFVFCLALVPRIVVLGANVALNGEMIGAGADANRFYQLAVERSEDLFALSWSLSEIFNGHHGFINLHALLQGLLGGPSFLLSHAFSLLGAAACLGVLARIWLLHFPDDKVGVKRLLWIYALTPSVLLYQSYILREVWQSLCLLSIAWLGSVIGAKGVTLPRAGLLLMVAFLGCFLHKAMPVIMPAVFVVGLMLANRISTATVYRPQNLMKIAFAVVIFGAVLVPLLSQSVLVSSLGEGAAMDEAEAYANRSIQESRAEYGNFFQANEPWTIVPAFLAYQLMPLPGSIGNLGDVLLFGENLFHMWLLGLYLSRRRHLGPDLRSQADLLLLLWFVVEVIWCLGTVNWGTAARHHVPAFGTLLICGYMAWRWQELRADTEAEVASEDALVTAK